VPEGDLLPLILAMPREQARWLSNCP